MKRLVLLFTLLALTASAQTYNRVGYGGLVISQVLGATSIDTGGGDCATTDTAIPHDEFILGFATNDTWTGWTVVGSTLITTNADSSSLTTGKVAGMCDTAMRFLNASSGTETYMRHTNSTSLNPTNTQIDITFHIYVVTPFDTAAETITLLGANPTTSPSTTGAAGIELNYDGTYMRVRARGATASSYMNLTASSWNKVTLRLGPTHTDLDVNDSGSPSTFSKGTGTFDYLHIGAIAALESTDACDFYIDLICVNTP